MKYRPPNPPAASQAPTVTEETKRRGRPRKAAAPKPPGVSHRERKERRRIMADMAMETSVSEVARHFGVSIGTVSTALTEFGHRELGDVPRLWRRSREGQNLRFVILKALLDGGRQVDVANAHNVTRAYVNALAKEAREAGFDVPEGRWP